MIDGTDSIYIQSGYYETYKNHIELAKTKTPLFNIAVDTAYADSANGSVRMTIVTADTVPDHGLVGHLAICQDSVPGNTKPEGYNYVCFYFSTFPLSMTYPDTLDTTIVFSHTQLVSKLYAVVFVQNDSTREVLQAATRKFEEVP